MKKQLKSILDDPSWVQPDQYEEPSGPPAWLGIGLVLSYGCVFFVVAMEIFK